MLNFHIQNKKYDFRFDGYKIIQTTNTNWLLKHLMICLDNEGIKINNQVYKTKNTMVISNLTKTSDLFNFTKTNYLSQILTDELLNFDEELTKIYDEILTKINKLIGWEHLDLNQDLTKIINAHYEFNSQQYLEIDHLYKWLSIPQKTKQLVIINDYNGIDILTLAKYCNYFDILIITTDCFKYLNYGQQLECVGVINDNNDYIDIWDYQQLNAAIETFINEPIYDNNWTQIKNNEYSIKNAKIKYCFNNIMFK